MTASTQPLSAPTETPSASDEPPDPPSLAARLAALLRPLRVLDALRWSPEVERGFLERGCRELPPVDRDYYASRPLSFSPEHLRDALLDLERDIQNRLGDSHPIARLMLPRCRQARLVVDLLAARGTPRFHPISRSLYGGSDDALPDNSPTLLDMSKRLAGVSTAALADPGLGREEQSIDSATAARHLATRLGDHFGAAVRVLVTDDVDANAAVGGDYLKLRSGAWFSVRDVRLLEVHEGWVHLGTTRNARAQPALPFLARLLPAATRTQEGLAVWTEILAFASHPARLRQLAGRVEAVAIAERGGDFLDVFRHFGELGFRPVEAYRQAARVFRGSLPNAGPFTKDLAYAHGFAEVGHWLREAVASGRLGQASLLFAGKVSVADLPALAELHVAAPRVPPPFADLRALAALACLLGIFGST